MSAENALDDRWAQLRGRWPIRVRQAGSTAIPPFSLVLISNTAVSSAIAMNEAVVPVRQPNAASTDFNWGQYLVTGPFAIGAASGSEGLAGTLAQPNWLSVSAAPSAGWMVGPKHGQFTAERNYCGYEILGQPTTFNGINIALARWTGVSSVLGKTDASVTGGSTVTVSVYSGTTAGSESDTTMNLTGCYLRYGYVPTSTFVHVKLDNGLPYIIGDHRQVIGKADANIAKGSSGTFSIYNNESDTTDNVTAKALGAAITGSKWATAWQEENSGNWYVGCWEV